MNSQLQRARLETDDLFALLDPGALYDRPIPERHRIVFYVGHLEAFDWNLLSGPYGLKPFDPSLDRLFAFGIDPVDGALPDDTPLDWPSIDAVRKYRDRVRTALDAATQPAAQQLVDVALEHRRMHAETLAYMFHQLPFDRKVSLEPQREAAGPAPIHGFIDIPAGAATLGLSRDSCQFGWDNEFDAHTVDVPGFSIARHKTTNAQFLRFVEEGGYDHRPFWTAADWEWKSQASISHPAFWSFHDGDWFYRSMFDELPVPPHWPVYVSHAEAAAYCRWAGAQLPTEAQWQRAAQGSAPPPGVDARIWDPHPVSLSPESGFGVKGMFGSGWEWTSTPFAPFEGFIPFPFYKGYSADFFDGRHYVMKGGSPRTHRSMLRPSFRNWFQPHYPYVYAGFRCVSSSSTREEP